MLALLFACARLGRAVHAAQLAAGRAGAQADAGGLPAAVLFVEPDFVAQTESILAELGDLRSVVMGGTARLAGVGSLCAAGTAAAPRAEADPQTPS
jgi:hypothetical protein